MLKQESLLLEELQNAARNRLIMYHEMFFSENSCGTVRTIQITFNDNIPESNIFDLFNHLKQKYDVFGVQSLCRDTFLFSYKLKESVF